MNRLMNVSVHSLRPFPTRAAPLRGAPSNLVARLCVSVSLWLSFFVFFVTFVIFVIFVVNR